MENPSFEDIPRAGGLGFTIPILGWHDCARIRYPDKSPPDIHPHPEGWRVTLDAQSGDTYLGLVVRNDDSREFVSQRLASPLLPGICYEFSVFLVQSEIYMGMSNGPQTDLNVKFSNPFVTPTKLSIWGGKDVCDFDELLGETDEITNHDWQEFTIVFRPEIEMYYFTLEAFYSSSREMPYNGHILLDNCSPITPIECE